MCAIVDANVANEVFGPRQSPAGRKFYDWINKKAERLVVGGKLLEELEQGSPEFRELASTLQEAGRIKIANADKVKDRTAEIERKCVSNDAHIIALAQLSGARLLYTNESSRNRNSLFHDFKNKDLIEEGLIYTTIQNRKFTRAQREMLKRTDICRKQ